MSPCGGAHHRVPIAVPSIHFEGPHCSSFHASCSTSCSGGACTLHVYMWPYVPYVALNAVLISDMRYAD
jgi:hypothetical protein